jgi:excisionase family DNA binding protein
MKQIEEHWMTKKEVAAYLRRSTKTVDRLRKNGILKGYRIAKRSQVLFKLSDVSTIFKSDEFLQ